MLGRKKNQNDGGKNFNMPEFSIPELDKKYNMGENSNINGSMNNNKGTSMPNGKGTPIQRQKSTPINAMGNSESTMNGSTMKQPKMKQPKMKQSKMKQPNNGKKFPFVIFIVLGVVLLLVAGLIIRGVVTGKENVPSNETVVTEQTGDTSNVENNSTNNENEPVDTENPDGSIVETPETPEAPTDDGSENNDVSTEPKFAFENDMLGIKFNYDSNLYIKENTEEIFNMVTQIIPPERETFNIYEDVLPDSLMVARLTTGDSDGLYVSISIVPFTIEKETTVLKVDGNTNVTTEEIDAVSLTDEELVEKYDIQIKDSLSQSGCQIVSYDVSTVKPVGFKTGDDGNKVLKGIMTSRVYTGPTDVTSSTGTVDLVQCTIPVGKNAIVITAVTDGRPIEIDKSVILNEIVESILVQPLGVEEETSTETDTVENSESTTNTTESAN